MKIFMIILCVACVGLSSPNNQKNSKTEMDGNPFFSDYNTPFNVPPFDKIKAEDYMPAFIKGMEEHKKEIEAIINNPEEPTFENTFVAMDESGQLLSKVSTVFFNVTSMNTNEKIQKIQAEVSPLLASHADEISLNPKVFERIKAVYDKRDQFNLNEEQSFLLESEYKEFVRNGANLPAAKKERLKEINKKLSSLKVKFNANLLTETNSFKLFLDKKDLNGLPESVVAAGAVAAKEEGKEGKYLYTIQRSSMYPFLTYSTRRDLREKLYKGYINKADNGNKYDNKAVVAEIIKLRAERANLLGYKNHAALTLEPRMAGTPKKAIELLNKLWTPALKVAKEERDMMQKMIDKEGGKFKLKSWDWWYYAEKIRASKYNLDEGEIRPYFKLKNVRDGAFWCANQLYGITFTQLHNIPLPHPDAEAFEVKEANGSHIGILYMDYLPRASKRGGAWCGSYADHKIYKGKEIKPIVTICCNLTKPTENTPSLLSIEEASTLFHEFGHGLDGLFSKCSYATNYIAWDFVELPSQIMEHWATEPEVLKHYAKNYKTGEVIPEALVKKIDAASKFNTGFATTEYLAAALLDLAYHTIDTPKDIDIAKFEKNFFKKKGLIPEIVSRYRTTYFSHIIGGYDAGYYSYIWAAVLDNDAFDAFKENGIFDHTTAESFRKNILAKNGIENAMKMFVNFRGREPKIEPLLKHRGLLTK